MVEVRQNPSGPSSATNWFCLLHFFSFLMSKFKISLHEPLVCPALNNIHSTLFGSKCLLCEVPKCKEHLKVNRNQTLCLKVYLLPFVNTPGFYFLLDTLLRSVHERLVSFFQLHFKNKQGKRNPQCCNTAVRRPGCARW